MLIFSRIVLILVLEVAHTRHHHRYAEAVSSGDAVGVTYGAPGLRYGCDPGLSSEGDTVIEGEEGITREYCPVEVKAEVSSLRNGLLEGIDT